MNVLRPLEFGVRVSEKAAAKLNRRFAKKIPRSYMPQGIAVTARTTRRSAAQILLQAAARGWGTIEIIVYHECSGDDPVDSWPLLERGIPDLYTCEVCGGEYESEPQFEIQMISSELFRIDPS